MKRIEYIILDKGDHPGWEEVAKLFTRMYAEMDGIGLMLPLAPDGTGMWLRTAMNTAGKFGIVILALEEGRAAGFAHGMIKFLPDYLGNHAIGTITHVFVEDKSRRSGVGKALVKKLEEWFMDKKVHSVELQVIAGNRAGKEFWEEMGYNEELSQYRKSCSL